MFCVQSLADHTMVQGGEVREHTSQTCKYPTGTMDLTLHCQSLGLKPGSISKQVSRKVSELVVVADMSQNVMNDTYLTSKSYHPDTINGQWNTSIRQWKTDIGQRKKDMLFNLKIISPR